MKLYNIYWTDSYGDKSLQATTNNCEKWLENNNEERPPCPECDGEGTHIYEGKKKNAITVKAQEMMMKVLMILKQKKLMLIFIKTQDVQNVKHL